MLFAQAYMERLYKWATYNAWGPQTLVLPWTPKDAKVGPAY